MGKDESRLVALMRLPRSESYLGEGESYELGKDVEVYLFNSRSEACEWQLKEEHDGWRGAWCLADRCEERRTNL